MIIMKTLLMLFSISAILLFATVNSISAQDSDSTSLDAKNMNELNSITNKLLKEKKFEEALFYLDKILEIDPNHTAALLNKGSILVLMNNSEEALTYYDRLLAIDPDNIKGLTSKAAALANIGENLNALELYNKALSIDKGNEKIGTDMARLLSITETIPISGSYDNDNEESIIDIHLRITVRNSSGELVSVTESKHGRYLPVSFFTDQVFDELFKKEIIEVNGQEFEVLKCGVIWNNQKNTKFTTGFSFSPEENGYNINVFDVFTSNVDKEMDDEFVAEWTVVRKSI